MASLQRLRDRFRRSPEPATPTSFDPMTFRRDGFQVVGDVFSAAERAELKRGWREHHGRTFASGRKLHPNPVEVYEIPRFLQELVIHPKLLAIPQAMFGENVALHSMRVLLKDKAWKGEAWFHHDGPYYRGPADKVSVFLALDQADAANGSLYFVRGSHHFGLMNGDYHDNQVGTIHRAFMDGDTGLEHECPTLDSGEMVVSHMYTWHYSKAATDDRVRAFLHIIYSPATDGYSDKLLSGRWQSEHYIPPQGGNHSIVRRPNNRLWRPS